MEKVIQLSKEELIVIDKALALYCKQREEWKDCGDEYQQAAELYNKLQQVRIENFGNRF